VKGHEPDTPTVRVGPVSHSDEAIGRHVRIMRTARNMTGEELAARCGVGHSKHNRLENGHIPFDIGLLVRLAEILDTTPGRLLDGPVTHRMLDLTGVPDEQATALEIMRDALVTSAKE
jgi:transcriptional regulator with XRE-family HTH domain